MEQIARYKALALQVTCKAINACNSTEEARRMMMETINRLDNQIRASKTFIGKDTRLVVLPEYFLTGYPMGEGITEWKDKACLDQKGSEYEALGEVARKNDIYLSGNAYETDPHFPDLYFQTSFIIDPQGEVILRYRRLNSMFAPTPHDLLDAYTEAYGPESLFPVAKTEIGNLACIASEEILYPEIARCLAMNGAQVFLHSSSEVCSNLPTPKNIAKQARAIENLAYVVSANSAGMEGIPIPIASADGASKVVDYQGLILAEAGYGESMVANAIIDLEALKAYRLRPGMGNLLARQRFELYAPFYAANSFYPANNLTGVKAERAHFIRTQLQVIDKLKEKGLL